MKQQDLPQRWQNNLKNYLLKIGSKYKSLSARDFKYNLKIVFADDSTAFFRYAFYIIDEELKEVGVFTEHCGYHIFNLPEIKLKVSDRQGNILKIENYQTE